jgi:hypothetical protein
VDLERALTDATFKIEQLQQEVLCARERDHTSVVDVPLSQLDRVARLEGRLEAANADNAVLQQTLTGLRAAHVRPRGYSCIARRRLCFWTCEVLFSLPVVLILHLYLHVCMYV